MGTIKDCKPGWYDVVVRQEEKLLVDCFSREDALQLGMLIVQNAKRDYGMGVAVKIQMEGTTAFSCAMGETGEQSYMWMACKYNTFLRTGKSSMRVLAERKENKVPFEPWCYQGMSYMLGGGAFPIRKRDGELIGCILVSGLEHQEDHQLIVDSLAQYLKVTVESIV
ncbi:MAG: hypothetical protein HFH53_11175 [Hespellia sp.]|jgi:uncharacterized protein (UPF0303 family)|nr:hypothetical protein [Hespellia sp.]